MHIKLNGNYYPSRRFVLKNSVYFPVWEEYGIGLYTPPPGGGGGGDATYATLAAFLADGANRSIGDVVTVTETGEVYDIVSELGNEAYRTIDMSSRLVFDEDRISGSTTGIDSSLSGGVNFDHSNLVFGSFKFVGANGIPDIGDIWMHGSVYTYNSSGDQHGPRLDHTSGLFSDWRTNFSSALDDGGTVSNPTVTAEYDYVTSNRRIVSRSNFINSKSLELAPKVGTKDATWTAGGVFNWLGVFAKAAGKNAKIHTTLEIDGLTEYYSNVKYIGASGRIDVIRSIGGRMYIPYRKTFQDKTVDYDVRLAHLNIESPRGMGESRLDNLTFENFWLDGNANNNLQIYLNGSINSAIYDLNSDDVQLGIFDLFSPGGSPDNAGFGGRGMVNGHLSTDEKRGKITLIGDCRFTNAIGNCWGIGSTDRYEVDASATTRWEIGATHSSRVHNTYYMNTNSNRIPVLVHGDNGGDWIVGNGEGPVVTLFKTDGTNTAPSPGDDETVRKLYQTRKQSGGTRIIGNTPMTKDRVELALGDSVAGQIFTGSGIPINYGKNGGFISWTNAGIILFSHEGSGYGWEGFIGADERNSNPDERQLEFILTGSSAFEFARNASFNDTFILQNILYRNANNVDYSSPGGSYFDLSTSSWSYNPSYIVARNCIVENQELGFFLKQENTGKGTDLVIIGGKYPITTTKVVDYGAGNGQINGETERSSVFRLILDGTTPLGEVNIDAPNGAGDGFESGEVMVRARGVNDGTRQTDIDDVYVTQEADEGNTVIVIPTNSWWGLQQVSGNINTTASYLPNYWGGAAISVVSARCLKGNEEYSVPYVNTPLSDWRDCSIELTLSRAPTNGERIPIEYKGYVTPDSLWRETRPKNANSIVLNPGASQVLPNTLFFTEKGWNNNFGFGSVTTENQTLSENSVVTIDSIQSDSITVSTVGNGTSRLSITGIDNAGTKTIAKIGVTIDPAGPVGKGVKTYATAYTWTKLTEPDTNFFGEPRGRVDNNNSGRDNRCFIQFNESDFTGRATARINIPYTECDGFSGDAEDENIWQIYSRGVAMDLSTLTHNTLPSDADRVRLSSVWAKRKANGPVANLGAGIDVSDLQFVGGIATIEVVGDPALNAGANYVGAASTEEADRSFSVESYVLRPNVVYSSTDSLVRRTVGENNNNKNNVWDYNYGGSYTSQAARNNPILPIGNRVVISTNTDPDDTTGAFPIIVDDEANAFTISSDGENLLSVDPYNSNYPVQPPAAAGSYRHEAEGYHTTYDEEAKTLHFATDDPLSGGIWDWTPVISFHYDGEPFEPGTTATKYSEETTYREAHSRASAHITTPQGYLAVSHSGQTWRERLFAGDPKNGVPPFNPAEPGLYNYDASVPNLIVQTQIGESYKWVDRWSEDPIYDKKGTTGGGLYSWKAEGGILYLPLLLSSDPEELPVAFLLRPNSSEPEGYTIESMTRSELKLSDGYRQHQREGWETSAGVYVQGTAGGIALFQEWGSPVKEIDGEWSSQGWWNSEFGGPDKADCYFVYKGIFHRVTVGGSIDKRDEENSRWVPIGSIDREGEAYAATDNGSLYELVKYDHPDGGIDLKVGVYKNFFI